MTMGGYWDVSPPGRLVGPPSHVKPPRRCVIVENRRRSKQLGLGGAHIFAPLRNILVPPDIPSTSPVDIRPFKQPPHPRPSRPRPPTNKSNSILCVGSPACASSLSTMQFPFNVDNIRHAQKRPLPTLTRTPFCFGTRHPVSFPSHGQRTIPQ